MDLNDAISGRRSTRAYTAQAVDDQEIRDLLDAAVHAPSASNGQPWTFTVVRDQGLLDRISDAAKAHLLATLPAGPQSDRQRMSLSDPDFQIFYHAPVLILISGIAARPWVVEDCALAAENLLLAAYGDGLDIDCEVGRRCPHLLGPPVVVLKGGTRRSFRATKCPFHDIHHDRRDHQQDGCGPFRRPAVLTTFR
jgi:hypothetical protein